MVRVRVQHAQQQPAAAAAAANKRDDAFGGHDAQRRIGASSPHMLPHGLRIHVLIHDKLLSRVRSSGPEGCNTRETAGCQLWWRMMSAPMHLHSQKPTRTCCAVACRPARRAATMHSTSLVSELHHHGCGLLSELKVFLGGWAVCEQAHTQKNGPPPWTLFLSGDRTAIATLDTGDKTPSCT